MFVAGTGMDFHLRRLGADIVDTSSGRRRLAAANTRRRRHWHQRVVSPLCAFEPTAGKYKKSTLKLGRA